MRLIIAKMFAAIDADSVGVPKIEASGVIDGTLAVVYWAAGLIAVIVLIIGGILYTVSDGDSSKIKRAKDMILYAIVGLVFVLMAFVVTNFIVGRF